MNRYRKLDVLGILQEHGAVMEGHFRLPSGLHTTTYIQTAVVLQYPHLAQKIAQAIADKFPAEIDVVVAPSMGAMPLVQEIARIRQVRAVFFERMGGVMGLYRHFRLEKDERVLVIEDILSGGHSTQEVVEAASLYGARIVGVGAVVDRSTRPLAFKAPVRALVTLPLTMRPTDLCDLCKRDVPLELPEERRAASDRKET
jgi:orotate phosphoribosyltransferase